MKVVLGTMTFSDQVNESSATQMLSLFGETSHREVDTAFVYNNGKTEKLLGQLNQKGLMTDYQVAGKANPRHNGLTPESVTQQLTESLSRLGINAFDLFYLHSPDLQTPIAETLACVDEHFRKGKFSRFGLSNYAAWQVAEIMELCKQNNWIQPSVYQGMYNAFTRDIERELLCCLANYNISFYVYNPLAGGMLTGKHTSADNPPQSGRFASFAGYQDRYWKADIFAVVESFVQACRQNNIAPANAAIRWLVHHSALENNNDHAIILGASSVSHLTENMQASLEGPLPEQVLQSLDEGWEKVRPVCIKYFRP